MQGDVKWRHLELCAPNNFEHLNWFFFLCIIYSLSEKKMLSVNHERSVCSDSFRTLALISAWLRLFVSLLKLMTGSLTRVIHMSEFSGCGFSGGFRSQMIQLATVCLCLSVAPSPLMVCKCVFAFRRETIRSSCWSWKPLMKSQY